MKKDEKAKYCYPSAKNWWYYNKWYIFAAVLIIGILCYIIAHATGVFSGRPDLQIAYIAQRKLPDETKEALEDAFAGFCEDYNHDRKVIVQINQYITGNSDLSDSVDVAGYQTSAEASIIGDITECNSYLFLMDDPKTVQINWQILANPDGSCPAPDDYGIEGKVYTWKRLTTLSSLKLGNYEEELLGSRITGESQEFLGNLYLGRRCFYDKKRVPHEEELRNIWNQIIESR